jgi:hypothetical protein
MGGTCTSKGEEGGLVGPVDVNERKVLLVLFSRCRDSGFRERNVRLVRTETNMATTTPDCRRGLIFLKPRMKAVIDF